MSGTKIGGMKAKESNLAKNPNFYKEIGRLGGLVSTRGGFATNPALAAIAGRKGGKLSHRRPKLFRLVNQSDSVYTYEGIKHPEFRVVITADKQVNAYAKALKEYHRRYNVDKELDQEGID